jgi:hypothetical protein
VTDLAVDSKWVIVSFTMVMDEGSKMVSERKPNVVWGRYCNRRKGESERIERRRPGQHNASKRKTIEPGTVNEEAEGRSRLLCCREFPSSQPV